MNLNFWFYLTLAFLLVNLCAYALRQAQPDRGWQRLVVFTKPLTLLMLIIWSWTAGDFWRGRMMWFGVALLFSLLGDICLLFPARWFMVGLFAFLLTHFCYLLAFNQDILQTDLRWTFSTSFPNLLLLSSAALLAGFVLGKIDSSVSRTRCDTRLRVVLLVYSLVLTLMLLSAVSTRARPDWSLQASLLASLGAGLFFASDILLAYNRFVRPLNWGNVWVIGLYHVGQVFLVLGALIFSRA